MRRNTPASNAEGAPGKLLLTGTLSGPSPAKPEAQGEKAKEGADEKKTDGDDKKATTSLFGGSTSGSLFGGSTSTTSATGGSLFGAPSTSGGGLFGTGGFKFNPPTSSSGGVFGSSLFGDNKAGTGTSLFGAGSTSIFNAPNSIFGQ